MTDLQERRAPGKARVPVETLVEICGNEPGIPAFEAEAIDVSARGMHLRTAYLPDQGAPLVCRFEEGGREIVVEGRVAWRREGTRGGEFGVQFTALDSSSVEALRGLCGGGEAEEKDDEPRAQATAEAGTRVRLHIDGLGSPMKARVRGGRSGQVHVGSNLEFLKVGRHLEIEDLEQGGRRSAQIDGVSVAIDPQTQIPQLVVALRFEGEEEITPQPSVMDFGREPDAPVRGFSIPAESVTAGPAEQPKARTRAASAQDNDASDGAEGDEADDAGQLRGRLGVAAAGAGVAAKHASIALARFSARAARSMGGAFKGASQKILELRKTDKQAPRRTTSVPPGGPVSVEGKRLRQQTQPSQADESGANKKLSLANVPRKKLMLGAGGAVLLASVLAFAVRPSAPPPGATTEGSAAAVASVAAEPSAAAQTAAPGVGASPTTANVPLFGPTPMATMEPAPLAPPTESADSVEASERAAAEASSAEVEDEGWPEEAADSDGKSASKSSAKSKTRPEDVAPWGRGKMHMPTVHRLRLDGPGAKIQGSLQPTGFTVLIPERKVMESSKAIASRDKRIARVKTNNSSAGAQITIQFKDGVPAYRVRLRRDFVEFLISETEKPAKSSKDKDRKKSAKSKSEKSGRG